MKRYWEDRSLWKWFALTLMGQEADRITWDWPDRPTC